MRQDLIQFLKECFPNAEDAPQLSFFGEYIFLSTDEPDFLNSNEQDIEKVYLVSTKLDGEVAFRSKNASEIIVRNTSTWKKSWAVFDTKSILGCLLDKEYEDLVKAIQEQLPPELKGKVQI